MESQTMSALESAVSTPCFMYYALADAVQMFCLNQGKGWNIWLWSCVPVFIKHAWSMRYTANINSADCLVDWFFVALLVTWQNENPVCVIPECISSSALKAQNLSQLKAVQNLWQGTTQMSHLHCLRAQQDHPKCKSQCNRVPWAKNHPSSHFLLTCCVYVSERPLIVCNI